MKFKDLKVGDVLYYNKMRFKKDSSKLYYLVVRIYEIQKLHKYNGEIITYKYFDCYNFRNGKLQLGRTFIADYSKSKISQMFK